MCGVVISAQGLLASSTAESIAAEPNIRVLALFDHEEVGLSEY
jgi:aspartyl aminopeptidase